MRKTKLIGMLLALSISNLCVAQQTKPDPPASEATTKPSEATTENRAPADEVATDPNLVAIRASAQAFVDAFNQADAAAVAGLWATNGEYIDDSGTEYVGRPAIEKAYVEYFAGNPDAKIRINIDSFKLLSETAALEEGTTLVEVPPAAASIGRYRAIHVKVDNKWQMASVRDTLVESSVGQRNLADLDWLIGTWVAEERGNKNESVCRWVCQQSFVQREFKTTLFDGSSASSGVQLIGWNPQQGHVQSWTFSSNGGHDIGVWTPTADGWVAQMGGMTGDGVSTTSTNLLRRLDDNTYVWQSVNRTMDGLPIQDTDEIVIKRQPATK